MKIQIKSSFGGTNGGFAPVAFAEQGAGCRFLSFTANVQESRPLRNSSIIRMGMICTYLPLKAEETLFIAKRVTAPLKLAQNCCPNNAQGHFVEEVNARRLPQLPKTVYRSCCIPQVYFR